MSDLQTLSDAFAELERRADATSGRIPIAPAVRRRAHTRPLLVAASVVATLAVATGVTLLTRGGDDPDTPAAAPPPARMAKSHHPAPAAKFRVPKTPQELADRFRVVLDGSATITVTDTGTPVEVTLPPLKRGKNEPLTPAPNASGKAVGAAIVGQLTAQGVTGGYDIQIFRATPGTKAMCDDPDRSKCSVHRLADGSTLAVGHESLEASGAPGGVTYQVDLVRPDHVEFLMHVSNASDPKGESAVGAAHPPLTKKQMIAIVRSDRW